MADSSDLPQVEITFPNGSIVSLNNRIISIKANVTKASSEYCAIFSFYSFTDDGFSSKRYDISISCDRVGETWYSVDTISAGMIDKNIFPNTFLHVACKITAVNTSTGTVTDIAIVEDFYLIRGRDTIHDTIGYFGVDSKARLMKKAYIGGSDGKAHRVVKAYIGDANGKAQLIYQKMPDNVQFKLLDSATENRRYALLGQARAGDFAIFAGGKRITKLNDGRYNCSNNVIMDIVAYSKDTNTAQEINGALPSARTEGASVTVGNNAIMRGGWDSQWAMATVWMWDSSLTRKALSNCIHAGLCGSTNAGGFGIFAGGWHTAFLQSYYLGEVYAYDNNGAQIQLTGLGFTTCDLSKNAYINECGLLICPKHSTYCSYSSTLTQSTAAFAAVSGSTGLGIATASSEDYAVLYNSTDNSITWIDRNQTFRKTALTSKTINKPQAVYLSKGTEAYPNGVFIVYGMNDGVTPSYILFDAKTCTLLKDSTNTTSDYDNARECVGCVTFADTIVMYNGVLGKPVYFKPTDN